MVIDHVIYYLYDGQDDVGSTVYEDQLHWIYERVENIYEKLCLTLITLDKITYDLPINEPAHIKDYKYTIPCT